MSMYCPACHAENDDAQTACTACGQPLSAAATPTLSMGSIVASRYEILGTLGKGGMGMVFKAKDRELDEIVALKILRPDVAGSGEMARRFRSEIKLARRVRHRNVCGIHEYGQEHGLQYISMEYIEGIDVKRLLRERGGLPPLDAFDIAIQLARGLEAIHEVGIIHRDLKTANAMIDKQGVVRLMDFGIAKKFDTEGSLGATAVGHIIGTPEYMSPEQARGEKIDFRSDIYALGIMIFELFAGKVPFQAETPIATIFKHLQDPPPLDGPAAAAIPASVVPVLAKCLAKEPDARYPTAGSVVEALREARAATFPDAATTPLPEAHTQRVFPLGDTRPSLKTPPPPPTVLSPTPVPTPPRLTPPPFSEVAGSGRAAPSPGADVATVLTATPPSRPAAHPPASGAAAPAPTLRPAAPTTPYQARKSPLPLIALGGVAFVVVAAAVVGVGLWVLPPTPSPTGEPTLEFTPTVELSPEATAAPTVQGATNEATPVQVVAVNPTPIVTRTALPTPTHEPTKLRLTPIGGDIPPTPAPTPTPRTIVAEETGVLQVVVKPWAAISIDNEDRGQTPLAPLKLKAGSHQVVLTHPEFQPVKRKVRIEPGKQVRLEIDLTWEGVRK
jgi:serine/threonine protein kinase